MPEIRAHSRRVQFAWAMYDFANSSFTTLVVTFIYATFFTKAIAPDEIYGTALWSRGVTVTALLVALLSPVLGAVADRGGCRKRLLLVTSAVTVIGTFALFFAEPGEVMLALSWFVVANVAYETANVFYNAFLPDLAAPHQIGRLSGYGWALGYVGGLLCMLVAMIGFVSPETPWFGLSKDAGENIRATNLLVAAWYAAFSVPFFLWVPEVRPEAPVPVRALVRATVRQLRQTLHEIRRFRQVVRFLVARLFFNDALTTIFAFGGIYAAGTFGFSFEEIMIFGIVLNVTAGLGALAFGYVDDRMGGKRTVQISIIGLAAATLLAVLAPSKPLFWTAGIVVGLFSGPNQSASRSLVGRFVPPDRENEFYGFYAFSGKATSFLGPFLLGLLTQLSGSQRVGVGVCLALFAVGFLFLARVDEAEGIRLSGRP